MKYNLKILHNEIQSGKLSSPIVYKYISIDSAKKVISDNSLKFSFPKEFNDPFDSRFEIDIEGNQRDIFNYLRYVNKVMSEKDILNYSAFLFSNPMIKLKYLRESFISVVEEMKICCFSEVSDNILMWSHYAKQHTGVCIKFDMSEDIECFYLPFRVEYSKEFPKFRLLKEFEDVITPIRCKSDNWSYEKEVRCLRARGGNILQPFRKQSMKEIIFGLRTSSKDVEDIKELVKQKNYKRVDFKKVQIVKNKYALTIV